MDDRVSKMVVSGEDLAFGIQFTMSFPENRQLTFTTAFPQDCNDSQLRKLLRRMSDASDYLDGVYRLRALKRLMERQEFELETNRQQQRNHELACRDRFERSNRKGSFKLSGNELAQNNNLQITEKRYVEEVKKLRDEIADLEKGQRE